MNRCIFHREFPIMEKRIKIYSVKNFEDSASGCIINMDMMHFRISTRRFVTIE